MKRSVLDIEKEEQKESIVNSVEHWVVDEQFLKQHK